MHAAVRGARGDGRGGEMGNMEDLSVVGRAGAWLAVACRSVFLPCDIFWDLYDG